MLNSDPCKLWLIPSFVKLMFSPGLNAHCRMFPIFIASLIMVSTFHQTIGANVCWRLLLTAIRKLSFLNLRPNKWLPLLWNYFLPYNWALINICWIFLCKEKMFVCNIFRFLKLVNSQTSGFVGFLGVTCHSHNIWDFFIFLCLSWMYKLSHKFRTT